MLNVPNIVDNTSCRGDNLGMSLTSLFYMGLLIVAGKVIYGLFRNYFTTGHWTHHGWKHRHAGDEHYAYDGHQYIELETREAPKTRPIDNRIYPPLVCPSAPLDPKIATEIKTFRPLYTAVKNQTPLKN